MYLNKRSQVNVASAADLSNSGTYLARSTTSTALAVKLSLLRNCPHQPETSQEASRLRQTPLNPVHEFPWGEEQNSTLEMLHSSQSLEGIFIKTAAVVSDAWSSISRARVTGQHGGCAAGSDGGGGGPSTALDVGCCQGWGFGSQRVLFRLIAAFGVRKDVYPTVGLVQTGAQSSVDI